MLVSLPSDASGRDKASPALLFDDEGRLQISSTSPRIRRERASRISTLPRSLAEEARERDLSFFATGKSFRPFNSSRTVPRTDPEALLSPESGRGRASRIRSIPGGFGEDPHLRELFPAGSGRDQEAEPLPRRIWGRVEPQVVHRPTLTLTNLYGRYPPGHYAKRLSQDRLSPTNGSAITCQPRSVTDLAGLLLCR